MNKLLLSSIIITLSACLHAAQFSLTQRPMGRNELEIVLYVRPDEGEALFKDYFAFSTDHPEVILTPWSTTSKTITADAKGIGSALPAFKQPFAITLHAQRTNNIPEAGLYFTYLSSNKRQPSQELFTLAFSPQHTAAAATVHADQSDPEKTICLPAAEPITSPKTFSLSAWSNYLEDIIKATSNFWVRFLLILLLGLFMSFTPCIYPMIPITVGILQGTGHRSLGRNIAHATAYSTGVAITFALLGLIAAASGTIFGSMMTSPVVVLLISALLIYLSGTMFGWYELYIPRSLQERQHTHHGSILSSFIFGAISGTVASPCLSPGLALVLCIVASLGSKIMGFLLLFAFGIGLSIPLMIIGTFSNSLNVLPRSGMWMVEFKKIFGFLLLGMALYYANNVLPYWVILWLLGLLIAIASVQYLWTVEQPHGPKLMKRLKSLFGILLLVGAVLIFVEAYQTTFHPIQAENETFWFTNYELARAKAKEEHKLLFLDFWAPFCSICTAIDKTVLKDDAVRQTLAKFVPGKIEMIMTDTTVQHLKETFEIVGLPVFIVIDPDDEKLIKRWGGELYHADKKAFIKELEEILK